MPAASVADELREAAAEIWEAQHAHPFVRGIGDGTLAVDRFAHFVRQDYLFLVEYARMLALGAARAPDLATMRRFAELAQAILGDEMALHRALAHDLGISEVQLEDEPPAPTTQAYTDFLVRTAALGELSELAAALLPCMWGYSTLGRMLAEHPPAEQRYARWVGTYADPGFAALAARCAQMLDEAHAEGLVDEQSATDAFDEAMQHEVAFWDVR